jgi:outer membrane biosynthesis protein TonB
MLTFALALALSPAQADVVTLDTGAQVDGHISHYEHGGDCGIEVDGGDFEGALLVVPCARVVRFERSPEAVAVVPLTSPLSAGPPETVVPLAAAVLPDEAAAIAEAPAATEPLDEPVVAEAEPSPTVAPEPAAEPEPQPQPEAVVAEESPEPEATEPEPEPEPAPTGWRAALPEGVQLPEFVRKRRPSGGS